MQVREAIRRLAPVEPFAGEGSLPLVKYARSIQVRVRQVATQSTAPGSGPNGMSHFVSRRRSNCATREHVQTEHQVQGTLCGSRREHVGKRNPVPPWVG